MEIKEFAQYVQRQVEEILGAEYKVKIQEVRKNNDVLMQGMTILSEQNNISPTIYLEELWEAYNNGISLSEIIENVVRIYKQDMRGKNLNMAFFKSFERVRDRICYRLISAEKNRKLLEDIPYIPYLDMAVSFYYAYQGDDLGMGTILVHNSHMEMWQTTVEELFLLAQENTPRLFPWVSSSIDEIMQECGEQQDQEEAARRSLYEKMPFRVLTNRQRAFGAACMLYPGVLEELAEKEQADFFILPSSVHEVILLADKGGDWGRRLKEMVEEINVSQTEPEEVLSDSLYYYDRTEKSIKVIF